MQWKYVTFTATGVVFTISKEKLLIGSSGPLTILCEITETDV
jgi:hypothetical protein